MLPRLPNCRRSRLVASIHLLFVYFRRSIAALVCDSAGWHQTGGELELPNNIVLLPLAPYSPELNPMENVWEYLRGNKLSARVWDSYSAGWHQTGGELELPNNSQTSAAIEPGVTCVLIS